MPLLIALAAVAFLHASVGHAKRSGGDAGAPPPGSGWRPVPEATNHAPPRPVFPWRG
ncbi:hypothetical protein KBZ08_08445 [Cyanobium sp. Candia 9D4]|uniref:hypothetical protein n=1 Tax=Cyanobium sp. Candia 9D4 TaxID=2823707 RepID=UPI0020CCCB62|nr:hypothetical protein [Cyanobium sp. Candia 9D4]MCP9933946.1 hypothetical protein [Cyanobium sp. Candia 9D4]